MFTFVSIKQDIESTNIRLSQLFSFYSTTDMLSIYHDHMLIVTEFTYTCTTTSL